MYLTVLIHEMYTYKCFELIKTDSNLLILVLKLNICKYVKDTKLTALIPIDQDMQALVFQRFQGR